MTLRSHHLLPSLALAACGGSRIHSMDVSSGHEVAWASRGGYAAPGARPTGSSSAGSQSTAPKAKEAATPRTYSTQDVLARASACGHAMEEAKASSIAPASVTDTCRDAASIADVACDQGDKEACAVAKSMHAITAVVPLLHQVAAAKSCATSSVRQCEATCDYGDLDACVEVGTMYTEGKRVARDFGRGVSILRSACDKGSMRACYTRGASLMVLDSSAAVASLKLACAGETAPWNDVSCEMLVTMLDRGNYHPSESDKKDLLTRLCESERSGAHTHGGTQACGRLSD